jgi:hypothetical protein
LLLRGAGCRQVTDRITLIEKFEENARRTALLGSPVPTWALIMGRAQTGTICAVMHLIGRRPSTSDTAE